MPLTTLQRKDALSSASAPSYADAETSRPEWSSWRKHLAAKDRPSLSELLDSRCPLWWGASGLSIDQDSLELVELLSRAARGSRSAGQSAAEQLEMWLRESAGGTNLQ